MKGLGLEEDAFKLAIEKYGIWPMTVWTCNFSDPMLKKLKREVGDGSWLGTSTRSNSFHKHDLNKKRTHMYNEVVESVFNPMVAIWILNLFGPENGLVYDPFAGGGTRAIVTVKKGLDYVGMEIRQDEVEAVNERLKNNKVDAEIICGDSKDAFQIKNQSADFLMTCPPYYNMEKYNGGNNDLSMCESYDDFLRGIEQVIIESFRILKSGSLSCWVVGVHRDKNGQLLSIPSDISNIHKKNGFIHKEEVVLYWDKNTTGAIQRVGNFEKKNKFLIRCHEYLEVFIKK
jgi:DNA modification methylase